MPRAVKPHLPSRLLLGASLGALGGIAAYYLLRPRAGAVTPSATPVLPPDEPQMPPPVVRGELPFEPPPADLPSGPPPPPLPPQVGMARPTPKGIRQMTVPERGQILTDFAWELAPTKAVPDAIRITDDWVEKHMVEVEVPQLKGVAGVPKNGRVKVHRLVAPRLYKLFADWEQAGLIDRVKSFASWRLSLARGGIKPAKPSTHVYGAALDINYQWNPYGSPGAPAGKEGSVWELVDIAAKNGWWWGGWWAQSDPHHFEFGIPVSDNA